MWVKQGLVSQDEIKEIKDLFYIIDTDKNGQLNLKEIKSLFYQLFKGRYPFII